MMSDAEYHASASVLCLGRLHATDCRLQDFVRLTERAAMCS